MCNWRWPWHRANGEPQWLERGRADVITRISEWRHAEREHRPTTHSTTTTALSEDQRPSCWTDLFPKGDWQLWCGVRETDTTAAMTRGSTAPVSSWHGCIARYNFGPLPVRSSVSRSAYARLHVKRSVMSMQTALHDAHNVWDNDC